MQANYISYFGKNIGLGQSELPCQAEVAPAASGAIVDGKKMPYAKMRKEKAKASAVESELFLQYSLDL
jgi:hypothetical protein